MSWLLSHTLHRVDKLVFRITDRKHTLSSLITGLPVIMLTTTGAKSGKTRTLPVLGLPDGDRIIVFASGYGKTPRLPAWYHNLLVEPDARATVRGVVRNMWAYEAEGEERERLWSKGLDVYPGFAGYQQRITGRSIPVMVLSPVE